MALYSATVLAILKGYFMASLFILDPSNKKEIVASAESVFDANKYKKFRDGCFEYSTSSNHNKIVTELKNLKVKFYHASSANKV
jgi:hypothetical protein